jgi:hypothetical protein
VFRHWLLTLGVVFMLVTANVLDRQAVARPLAATTAPTPTLPISQSEATTMGLIVAHNWGEPHPVVIGAAQSSSSDWLAQLKAYGQYLNMGDQGALWLVRLSGQFTVDRAPPGVAPPQCQKMFVVIVVASGDIISVGCE